MATDIKISELNEITINNDLNHIIVNDRENAGDAGITKKVTLSNLLTPNIVKEVNIANSSVTGNKVAPLAIDCSKIANRTITTNQIAQCGIDNYALDSNSVDSRAINNNCTFTIKGLTVTQGPIHLNHPDGCLAIESGVTKLNAIRYYWPSSQTAGNFLKTDGAGGLSWAEAVPGEATSLVFSEIMPVGTIIPWGGIGDTPDDKWLECNGSTFDGTLYPELSAALGTSWGSRSGTNNELFRLPNLNGRTIVGKGQGTDINGVSQNFNAYSIGGEYKHQLTCDEMPNHCHNLNGYNLSFNNNWPHGATSTLLPWYNWSGAFDKVNYNSTADTGGNQSHNNVQPYAVTRYIIKAKKDDVQQFNPTLGAGLSASDAGGGTSTLTLTSTNIGVKISGNNLTYDGSSAITMKDDISVNSIQYSDGTLQDTYERIAFYTVDVSNTKNHTQPSDFVGNIMSTHSEYSKGTISTGYNNKTYTVSNSQLYTMNVRALTNTTITLKNYVVDDHFYVYVNGSQQGPNYLNYNQSGNPRDVPINLTTGNNKIEIVVNDSGSGSRAFDLVGDIISSNVLFLSGK